MTFVYLRFVKYGSLCYGSFIFKLSNFPGFCFPNSLAIQECGAPLRGPDEQSVKKGVPSSGLCSFGYFPGTGSNRDIPREDSGSHQNTASINSVLRTFCYTGLKIYFPFYLSQMTFSHIIQCQFPDILCELMPKVK